MKTNKHPEQYASFYTEKNLNFSKEFVRRSFSQFSKSFTGRKCLELGPATGYMTELLVKHFEHVTAVEGSPTLISQIPDYDNLTKILALFEDYKTTEKFDTIICNHVLEHIEDPVSLLTGIKQWLADDGVLIIGVPNAQSFHRLAAVQMGLLQTEYTLNARDHSLGHYRVYDFASLEAHVNEADYSIIKRGGIFLKFLSNEQIVSCLEAPVIDAYFALGEKFLKNSAEIYLILKKYK